MDPPSAKRRRSTRAAAKKNTNFTYRELFESDDEEDSTPELNDVSDSDSEDSDSESSDEPPMDTLDVIDAEMDVNSEPLCDPKVCVCTQGMCLMFA